MKNIIKISIITLMAINMLQAEAHYEVKSAKIELEITSTQTVGSISTKEIGKKRIVIDNYGELELEETNSIKKSTVSGKTTVDKHHYITYLNGPIMYAADFNKKSMTRRTGYMGVLFGTKKYKGSVENMLKLQKMKKIGTDKVAGQTCDVWQLGEMTKICFYKGLPLREETTLMGMKRVVVATKAEFDIELKKEDFKLPNYPIDGKKYTHAELEEMDKKEKNKVNERKKEEESSMAIMEEAYKVAGVDPKKGRPTKEQMQQIRTYMQKAMFPIQKKKFLEETKDIKNIKNCLTQANTLKEANSCKPDGESDGYDEWNSKIKKETLEEISMFENTILPCVEKAQNGKEMQVCFPEDK